MAFFRFTSKQANKIDAGTNIVGNIHSENRWLIAGGLTGDLVVMDNVIIESTAEITGNITGENIRVAGKVKGNIIAKSHLHLTATGSIEGDITYQTVEIEDGAHYSGAMITDNPIAKSSVLRTLQDRQEQMKEEDAVLNKEHHVIRPPAEEPAYLTKNKRLIIQ